MATRAGWERPTLELKNSNLDNELAESGRAHLDLDLRECKIRII